MTTFRFRKILFPTDFSRCANQALMHAVYLARYYEAELHMLHAVVLYEYTDVDPENIHIVELHHQREQLATERMRSVKKEQTTGIPVVVRAKKRGISAAPVILEYAEDHSIDLVVMGTHGRRGLKHLFLGSVAEEVVRLAPCPVLTVHEVKEPRSGESLKRILVPVDFSTYSQQALAYGRELAASVGACLQLLHIVEPILYPSFYPWDRRLFDVVDDIEQEAVRHLRRAFDENDGPSVGVEFYVSRGRAATDIVDFAGSESSDLIVIASHGLTGLERLFLGGVSEKVVRRAPCPVLLVKSFGKSIVGRLEGYSAKGQVS